MWKKSFRHRLWQRHVTVGSTSYENFSQTQQRETVACAWKGEQRVAVSAVSLVSSFSIFLTVNCIVDCTVESAIEFVASSRPPVFSFLFKRRDCELHILWKQPRGGPCTRLCPIHLRHPSTMELSVVDDEYKPTLYFSAQCQNLFSLLFFSFLVCLQPLYNNRLQLVHPTINRIPSSDIVHFYSDYFIILTFGCR